jgi:sec-independent protein translocase protein TatC
MAHDEEEPISDNEMPFEEHLEELRRRLFRCLISVFLGTILCYVFINRIVEVLRRPLGDYKLVILAPNEAFMAYLKLSLYCGIIVAVPVIFYQMWRFVSIALFPKEKRIVLTYLPLSLLLFFIGASFAYFFALPIGLKFLLTFPSPEAHIEPMLSLSKYIGFVGMFLLGFGAVFQLPLIVLILANVGIVSPRWLAKKRRHVILAIFIIAAIVTPPDVVTQCLMAIPLVILYEISIWLARIFVRRKEKEEEHEIED